MVDEFQDTDPIQWDILRRAFAGHRTLVLIGDPKQAIYAFRGADVYSYLDAVGQADRVQTLSTNWRSDAALVSALDQLMGGAALGEPQIVVRPVRADHVQRRLLSDSCPDAVAPMRVRVIRHEPDAERVASVHTHRPRITADLVADITAVLASDLQVDLGDGPRDIRPADIAVLVRTNSRGESIRDALVAAGLPAVLHGSGSVFASPMAEDWLTLLVALEQPWQNAVRQAALTCFFGWTFAELAAADETRLSELTQRVRWWAKVLASRGIAALLETATTDTGLRERLLATTGGERQLTDLRHLGQSLHAAMVSGQLGVSALVEWLRARMAEARANTAPGGRGGVVPPGVSGAPEGTRRLETDARAVSVLTVHRSKGLEFPLVYLPDAWDRYLGSVDDGRILRLHDVPASTAPGDSRGDCVLDVGGRWGPGRSDRWRRGQAEEAGEDLRLFYVAATRAQCQVVTWWAPSVNTPASALQRLIYRPTGGEASSPAAAYELVGDPFGARDLGPYVRLEALADRAPADWRPPSDPISDPGCPSLRPGPGHRVAADLVLGADRGRPRDRDRARRSGQRARARQGGRRGDPGRPGGSRPTGIRRAGPSRRRWPTCRPEPSSAWRCTRCWRTWIRRRATWPPRCGGPRRPYWIGCHPATSPRSSWSAALLPAFRTPLGPLAGQRTLADIPRADRLAELGFELPLAGGEVTQAEIVVADLAAVLRDHLAPDDPLARYPEALADPALASQTLRGFLTGSIDAVLRVHDPEAEPRYLVVDYKTNWLGRLDGHPLLVGDYAPPRMAEAMLRAHYPLQALLYSVAVHRLLRWRQPGYDPDRHLGGVLYLFVRGMAGPQTPVVDQVPCGVFSWRPSAALVSELSDLLDGGRR